MLEELYTEKTKPSYTLNYREVHDKMVSRLIGRDTQIDTILSVIDKNDGLTNPSKRSAMIIAGTTGTGKTQTYTELKKALQEVRPVNVVDTNQITQQGYIGGSVEDNILAPLIIEAHNINNRRNNTSDDKITDSDIKLAEHGIVILDEIDKRAESGSRGENVNKGAVIHQLLKLMDPSNKYNVKIGKQAIEFDTSTLTIFASGAFQEYFEEVDKKKTATLGFNREVSKEVNTKMEFQKYNEVDPNALVQYGLDRQFIGRFNRVVLFPPHTVESLLELENNKATSNIQIEIERYALKGINFVWEDGFIEEVVKKAYEMKTGGRALATIIARALGNLDVEVNNRPHEFKIIYVPIKALESSGNIMLINNKDECVLLSELYKETEKRNRELKQINKIEKDNQAYIKALQAYKALLTKDEDLDKEKVLSIGGQTI